MSSGVRHPWLWTVVDRLQTAAGSLALLDRADVQAFLGAMSASLPECANGMERLILRSLLLEFAAESGDALHKRAHGATRAKKCNFMPASLLELLWKPRSRDPVTAFRQWVDTYFAHFNQAHPMSPANRVAHLLRQDFQREWDIAALARRVHATDAQITRGFRREYGRSISEYLRRVRLLQACERLRRGEKVDGVALDVGYRSKNFYGAFRRLTGMSPAAFRQLAPNAANQLMDAARLTLGPGESRRSSAHAPQLIRDLAADSAHASTRSTRR